MSYRESGPFLEYSRLIGSWDSIGQGGDPILFSERKVKEAPPPSQIRYRNSLSGANDESFDALLLLIIIEENGIYLPCVRLV